jgi:hypothetical protein
MKQKRNPFPSAWPAEEMMDMKTAPRNREAVQRGRGAGQLTG